MLGLCPNAMKCLCTCQHQWFRHTYQSLQMAKIDKGQLRITRFFFFLSIFIYLFILRRDRWFIALALLIMVYIRVLSILKVRLRESVLAWLQHLMFTVAAVELSSFCLWFLCCFIIIIFTPKTYLNNKSLLSNIHTV